MNFRTPVNLRAAKLALLAVAAVLAVPQAAWGHAQTLLDRADSEGPLDVAAARVTHKTSGETGRRYLDLQLLTYEGWSDDRVAGGSNFVSFELNWDRDPNVERCVVVQQREVEPGAFALEATVNRDCTYLADERVTSTFLVTRPDDHSVRVQVPSRAVLGRGVAARWRAVTSFQQTGDASCAPGGGEGGYGACSDFTRWIAHR